MGQPAEISISVGDLIDGKFRVHRVLGVGGGGVVLCVTHLHLDQLVALKAMRSYAAKDPTLVSRFMREARAASRLRGEHVARVTDVGMPGNGTPYMVMEYLQGEELNTLIRRRGPLPVQEAVTYVMQACDAVAEAHSLGIIHRDIKPSNLFLTHKPNGEPSIKVLDFGISKTLTIAPVEDDLTSSEAMLGTPHYMSPEQMRASREADRRSDIWGIGVVLYTLLAGHRPFRGGTMAEIYAATLRDPAPLLRSERMDIPEELDRIVAKCLEKEPADRYQNVQQLAAALLPFLPDASRKAWPYALAPAPPSQTGERISVEQPAPSQPTPLSAESWAIPPGSSWSETAMPRKSAAAVPVIIVTVCLLVAGGAVIGAIASSSPEPQRVSPVYDGIQPLESAAPSEPSEGDDTVATAAPSSKPSTPPPRSRLQPSKPTPATKPAPARPLRDFGERK